MTSGTSFADAIPIHDLEASRYWSNTWWADQPNPYDAFAYGYRPGYWVWVPTVSGWYSIDGLNSKYDAGSPFPVYAELFDAAFVEIDHGWAGENLAVEVTAGQTYYVALSADYDLDARYSARVSAVAEWSDWITPDPVTFTDAPGLQSRYWMSKYTISRAFGGLFPGEQTDTYPCAWNWGRKGNYGSQYWSPDGTISPDGITGWDNAPGTCLTQSGNPAMANPDGSYVGYLVEAQDPDVGGHENLSALVNGLLYSLAPSDIATKTNADLAPGGTWTAREFEDGAVDADLSAAQVVLTDTAAVTNPSKILPDYPTWTTTPGGWGPFLNNIGYGLFPWVAGSTSGPESAGTWSDFVQDAVIDIDLAALATSAADAAAAGAEDSNAAGWVMNVVIAEALSSSVPSAVVPGTMPQYVAQYGAAAVRLDVTYQAARYRTVTPVPPDLMPPAGVAPPCQLYPRDDDQGVGTAAIWPPPSSGRPGSYY